MTPTPPEREGEERYAIHRCPECGEQRATPCVHGPRAVHAERIEVVPLARLTEVEAELRETASEVGQIASALSETEARAEAAKKEAVNWRIVYETAQEALVDAHAARRAAERALREAEEALEPYRRSGVWADPLDRIRRAQTVLKRDNEDEQ
jgi:chromosome segregation ATPase